MRDRLPLILLTLVLGVWGPSFASAQREDPTAGQEKESGQRPAQPVEPDGPAESAKTTEPSEPAPPAVPTVTRSTGGIIVVTGVGSGSPVKVEAAEKQEDATADPGQQGQAAAPAGDVPRGPQTRTVSNFTRGPGGRQPSAIQITGASDGDSRQTTNTLTNINGRSVPYLSETENVFNPAPGRQVVERRTHRYDTVGNPVSQQLVREEERRLPDGSIEKTTTVYESDINGRMNAVERIVETEKKVGNVTRIVVTAERPDINRRFKAYERAESERTQHSDTAANVKTARQVDNGAGRMIDVERSESIMSRAGDTSTTETKIWKRSVVDQDRFEFTARSVGKLVEKPDGSTSETVELYAASSGGGATNLNAGGKLQLQERIQRETSKAADGSTVETTTSQSRGIADPSRFGAKAVQRQVTRSSATGKTIETHSYEEDVNGAVRPTGTTVERIANK